MEIAERDFRMSAHDDQDIVRMRKVWHEKEKKLTTTGCNIYEEFKKFYTTELQELYINKKPKRYGKAQLMAEDGVTDRISTMEERLNTFEDIQDVHSGLLSETVKPHTISVPTLATQNIAPTRNKYVLSII